MANLLFIHPRLSFPGFHSEYPIGISCVSAYCRAYGHDVVCVNTCLSEKGIDRLIEEQVRQHDFDAICTGGMSVHHLQIKEVVDAAKAVAPDVKTVVGGPFVTSDPELALQMVDCDIGVIGEGEFTMAELSDALSLGVDYSAIQGIAYRREPGESGAASIVRTEERPYIRDLNELPSIDYEDFDYASWLECLYPNSDRFVYSIHDRPRIANIVTSRSCPYSCTFCYHPLGRVYRQRALDKVFEEIEYLVRTYEINLVNVMDELFSVDKARILDFCDRIKPFGVKWFCQVRVTDVDDEVLSAFKDSGGYLVSYGIESVSAPILKSMKKRIAADQIDRALSLTREKRLGIQANLIFGDLEETRETATESIEWWKSHLDYGLYLLMILAVPDSHVYRTCLERGLIADKKKFVMDRFPVMNFSKMSDADFDELQDFVARRAIASGGYLNVGEILTTESGEEDGKTITCLACRCPECGGTSRYDNLLQFTNQPYTRLLCRQCRLVVSLPSKKVFPNNYRLRRGNVSRALISNFVLVCYRSKFLYRTFISSSNKNRIYGYVRRVKKAIRGR